MYHHSNSLLLHSIFRLKRENHPERGGERERGREKCKHCRFCKNWYIIQVRKTSQSWLPVEEKWAGVCERLSGLNWTVLGPLVWRSYKDNVVLWGWLTHLSRGQCWNPPQQPETLTSMQQCDETSQMVLLSNHKWLERKLLKWLIVWRE